MARATLEMFIKVLGANKAAKELDNVSDSAEKTHNQVNKNTKENAKFAAGMSSLTKGAIAGAALFAGKQLLDFAQSSIIAASAAQEAAGAFSATFGPAAEKLEKQLAKNANLFGLTTSEAKQLTGTFGAVAQGIGFTQQESADLSSRLFELSGDIASFNNITAGAQPVLQAFRSAIVGERESLKTYGIAIQEADVQTKAFAMTGKSSADELTKQEKALATVELAFAQAGVQIGNAARESEGYAAQVLQSGSATRELKEQVGEQLLPAAGELIGLFNNFVTDVSPAVVGAFGLINDAIVATVDASQKGTSALEKYFRIFILGQAALYGNEEAVEEFNKAVSDNTEILNENSVQVFGSTGFSQDFFNVIAEGRKAYSSYTQGLKDNRTQVLINTAQTKKYGDEINKKLNPIFGESNSLILSNIQLEIERKKILDLISSGNKNVAVAIAQRNQAAKELQELQIQENVRDAEAAIRKAELQTQIALLTEAQSRGKDVTLDLALAEAQLAEAEFELANDSDRLKVARDALTIAENNLEAALKNQEKARIAVRDALIGETAATKEDTKERNKNADAIEKQLDLLRRFRAIETAPLDRFLPTIPETKPTPELTPEISPTPAPLVSDRSGVIDSGLQKGGGETTVIIPVSIGDEKIEEVIQKVNTRIQTQGKTFQII